MSHFSNKPTGLLTALKYGAKCGIENNVIQPLEPICCFKIDSNQSHVEEFTIGISKNESLPFDGCNWSISEEFFTSASVTLVSDSEPECAISFTRKSRHQSRGNYICLWSSSGCQLNFNGETFCLLEGEKFEFETSKGPGNVMLEAIKGRSGVRLRIQKPLEILIQKFN